MEATWMEVVLVLGVLLLALGGVIALEWVRSRSRYGPDRTGPRPTRAETGERKGAPARTEAEPAPVAVEAGKEPEGEGEAWGPEPGGRVGRRRFFHWLLGFGFLGTFAAMLSAASSLKPLVIREAAKEIGEGDRLVFATGPRKGQPLTQDALGVGEGALALPQGKEDLEENLVLVVRLTPGELSPPTKLEWTDRGFVAYSAICTHLGCTVLEKLQGGGVFCPCHGGVFDPRRGALVVSGPPPRPLPQLPIRINEQGEIVAAGPFTEEVGP